MHRPTSFCNPFPSPLYSALPNPTTPPDSPSSTMMMTSVINYDEWASRWLQALYTTVYCIKLTGQLDSYCFTWSSSSKFTLDFALWTTRTLSHCNRTQYTSQLHTWPQSQKHTQGTSATIFDCCIHWACSSSLYVIIVLHAWPSSEFLSYSSISFHWSTVTASWQLFPRSQGLTL